MKVKRVIAYLVVFVLVGMSLYLAYVDYLTTISALEVMR